MAWHPDYLDAEELKSALVIADEVDDVEIGVAITAASRAIDHFTGRQFGKDDEGAIRYYPARALGASGAVEIDDLMDTTGLVVKVDENNDGSFALTLGIDDVAGQGFRLYPLNAAADGRPWTEIRGLGGRTFPQRPRAVEVTAAFGWAAVPALVKQAALIQAARFFKRKDAPFGVAGSPDTGSEMRLLARLDPDVEMLLATVRRRWLLR